MVGDDYLLTLFGIGNDGDCERFELWRLSRLSRAGQPPGAGSWWPMQSMCLLRKVIHI